jgi:hypothetical protein
LPLFRGQFLADNFSGKLRAILSFDAAARMIRSARAFAAKEYLMPLRRSVVARVGLMTASRYDIHEYSCTVSYYSLFNKLTIKCAFGPVGVAYGVAQPGQAALYFPAGFPS